MAKHHKISHLEIHPAKNGYTVKTHYENDNKNGYQEPDESVFTEHKPMLEHVQHMLKRHEGKHSLKESMEMADEAAREEPKSNVNKE